MTVKQELRACEKERRQCLVDIHGNLLTVPHAVTEFTSDPKEKQLTKEAAEAVLLMANDGYTNAQACLGANSPLFASGGFVRSGLTLDTEELTTAYRESWLAKKIIDLPSEDMTRAWYKPITSQLHESDLLLLKKTEAEHSVKQEITNAIRWARLYGGSIALMVIRGDEDRLEYPLDMDLMYPGCFQGLLVLDRTRVTPSMELEEDLDDPEFGLPKYYELELGEPMQDGGTLLRIHHSRVLRFVGRELPDQEAEREQYWGASELEHMWDEIRKHASISANIAQLTFQANITTLKMGNLGAALTLGSERTKQEVMQAIENQNRLRTSYGLQVLSAEDSMENHPYSFAGLAELYETFCLEIAGASEIPATKLFGRSPQGMNATGESDLRNYYDMIAQMQERMLRPALERLLPVMMVSSVGFVPDDLQIVFEPVMTISPVEKAELSQKLNQDVLAAFQCGLITKEEARKEMKERGERIGAWGQL